MGRGAGGGDLKFACDRCGKRYASVDEPAPGRVYRVRCRCGHVIVVRGAVARGAPGARLRPFEPPPLPPPLEPSRGAPPGEPEALATGVETARTAPGARGADRGDRAREEGPRPSRPEATAPVAAASPGEAEQAAEPAEAIADDPFARAAAAPEREGHAAPSGDEAAVSPGPVAVTMDGAAPASGTRPVLSLGLDEDGAGGARRRVLLVTAVAALLALVATLLAIWGS